MHRHLSASETYTQEKTKPKMNTRKDGDICDNRERKKKDDDVDISHKEKKKKKNHVKLKSSTAETSRRPKTKKRPSLFRDAV